MASDALVGLAYQKSIELLRTASSPHGFLASPAKPHYAAVWARDALITSLGACLSQCDDLLVTTRNTLTLLATLQAPLGQVPAAFWPHRRYWDWGEAGCVDGMALLPIAAYQYYETTADISFIRALWPNLVRAFTWLTYQDVNYIGLINSPEAGDWMDSSLNRTGKVFYINVLYYWAARAMERLGAALREQWKWGSREIASKANLLFWPSTSKAYDEVWRHVAYPPDAEIRFPHPASVAAFRDVIGERRFYVSHIGYGQVVDKCDVLANLLAIISGLADAERSELILEYLDAARSADPYPVRVWLQPETPPERDWGMFKPTADRFQDEEWRNPPYCYHNGAIWPFVGGFYVAALARGGHHRTAEQALVRLARANQVGVDGAWEFREWLHGQTGEPHGAQQQTWNAGMYVVAQQALEGKQVAR
jgi:glycogen debranching enzyme